MILAGGVYLWNQNSSNLPPREVLVEGKVDGYDSLDEIEEKVSIIVKATKISEDDPLVKKNERGNLLLTGTIGNVKITEIYKDESNRSLAVDDILPIYENEAYVKSENAIYHVAGYQKMLEDKEYMLFLDYSEGDEWYVPCSAIWGKYPMDSTESILFRENEEPALMSRTPEPIDMIAHEVLEKYKD